MYKLQWKASNVSVMDVLASLCTDCHLSILGLMLDKHTRMSFSTTSLDLYFVFIFMSAENAVSHKYVVANGNKMFKLLKTMQTMTTFWNPLADPLGTRCGPPLVRGPQFENRCVTKPDKLCIKSCCEQQKDQNEDIRKGLAMKQQIALQ